MYVKLTDISIINLNTNFSFIKMFTKFHYDYIKIHRSLRYFFRVALLK